MSNNYPTGNAGAGPNPTPPLEPPPGSDPGKNRTLIILASILAVVAVIALIIAGWAYANRDSGDTAATTAVTSSQASPAEETATKTTPQESSEPGTATLTNTVTAEPTIPATSNGAPAAIPADACEPALFQEAGHDFVDNVMFCGQGWARAGMFQTDYVRVFHWMDDAWAMYPPSGESEISGYPCYDTAAMSAQGAPNLLLMETLDCQHAG